MKWRSIIPMTLAKDFECPICKTFFAVRKKDLQELQMIVVYYPNCQEQIKIETGRLAIGTVK